MGKDDQLDEINRYDDSKQSKDSENQNNQFNLISSVGNVFRKAYDSIKLLKSNLKDHRIKSQVN